MPELAEVEYYRRIWAQGIGLTVTRVDLHPEARVFRGTTTPDPLPALDGATLATARAHGKQLLFGFTGAGWLGVHLGMSGQLFNAPPGHLPQRHDHLVIHSVDRSLVFRDPRMFGRIRFQPGVAPPNWWLALPPEILSRAFTQERFTQTLAKRPGTPLKPLLLDQAFFPGVGNWMADEILWRARLHPATPAKQLQPREIPPLWRTVRQVARDAMRVIAPDWGEAPDHWLFNHRWKAGGLCPRRDCRAPLSRAELRGRTTCWCPRCQILVTL